MEGKAAGLEDEDLFQYYAAEWDRYTTAADLLNRPFALLNRYWVKPRRNARRRDVCAVDKLALV
ncbi:hypothetical protein GYMLUDRAFT_40302 [Collybiopsis luxurians FD-317 M1]|uniref:Uncharacterized protein n=1 Tax=Collybiopsis luxurians FD-317 M1 TaxID=944289 RepID=A0A0D0D436_9AGAR|nr:hypothetical protein GYMLUDRAFT_40302 [Collybiopsis luxurians FD-317 M1]